MGGASDEREARLAESERRAAGSVPDTAHASSRATEASRRIGRRAVLGGLALIGTTGCIGDGATAPQTNSSTGNETQHDDTNASDDDGVTSDGPHADDGGDDGGDRSNDRPQSIDSNLHGLTTTDDVAAYAERYGYRLRNGSVEVTVDLRANATLPSEPSLDDVRRYDGLVAGYVAIDDLVALAEHRNVSYVDTPDVAMETTGGAQPR